MKEAHTIPPVSPGTWLSSFSTPAAHSLCCLEHNSFVSFNYSNLYNEVLGQLFELLEPLSLCQMVGGVGRGAGRDHTFPGLLLSILWGRALVLYNLYISFIVRYHHYLYNYLGKLYWAKSFLYRVFKKSAATLISAKFCQENNIGERRVRERKTHSSDHFWELNLKQRMYTWYMHGPCDSEQIHEK